jgi:hypothetical protein
LNRANLAGEHFSFLTKAPGAMIFSSGDLQGSAGIPFDRNIQNRLITRAQNEMPCFLWFMAKFPAVGADELTSILQEHSGEVRYFKT